MITCQDVLSHIDDLVDNELPADRASEIREHIENCDSCRKEYYQTTRLLELLNQQETINPGDNYWNEVTALIKAKTVDTGPIVETEKQTISHITSIRRTALIRAIVSAVASLAILFSALIIGSQQSKQLTQRELSSPILATADVRELLGSDNTPIFTVNDQRQLARGMLLVGSPGILGKFAGLPDLINLSVTEK